MRGFERRVETGGEGRGDLLNCAPVTWFASEPMIVSTGDSSVTLRYTCAMNVDEPWTHVKLVLVRSVRRSVASSEQHMFRSRVRVLRVAAEVLNHFSSALLL